MSSCFGDEAGNRSDHHGGTTWAPQDRTPVVCTTGSRFGMNLISAVSTQGQLGFMVTPQRMTATVFVDFLRRLQTMPGAIGGLFYAPTLRYML